MRSKSVQKPFETVRTYAQDCVKVASEIVELQSVLNGIGKTLACRKKRQETLWRTWCPPYVLYRFRAGWRKSERTLSAADLSLSAATRELKFRLLAAQCRKTPFKVEPGRAIPSVRELTLLL